LRRCQIRDAIVFRLVIIDSCHCYLLKKRYAISNCPLYLLANFLGINTPSLNAGDEMPNLGGGADETTQNNRRREYRHRIAPAAVKICADVGVDLFGT
jgi:hypothetical protein